MRFGDYGGCPLYNLDIVHEQRVLAGVLIGSIINQKVLPRRGRLPLPPITLHPLVPLLSPVRCGNAFHVVASAGPQCLPRPFSNIPVTAQTWSLPRPSPQGRTGHLHVPQRLPQIGCRRSPRDSNSQLDKERQVLCDSTCCSSSPSRQHRPIS